MQEFESKHASLLQSPKTAVGTGSSIFIEI